MCLVSGVHAPALDIKLY